MAANYRQHELKKRREYGLRVCEVDRGCFTPLVFTTGGGLAPEASVFLKHLAGLIAEECGETYSNTIGWIRHGRILFVARKPDLYIGRS